MGNWMTICMEGTCPADEIVAVRMACDPGEWLADMHPLSIGQGLAGIGDWPAETINVSGNVFERDYGPGDVADALKDISKAAPGLRLKVHCGGDYESEECVATVTLDDEGVRVGPPERETVQGVSPDQMRSNLLAALMKR